MLKVGLLVVSILLLGLAIILPRAVASDVVVINDLSADTYLADDSYADDFDDDIDPYAERGDSNIGSSYSDVGGSNISQKDDDDYIQLTYKDDGKKSKKSASAVGEKRPATGRKVFIYNPRTLRWSVYDGSGNFVRSGHGSGGRGYCPDIHRGCRTPSGTYHIFSKAGAGFRSSRYPLPSGGAPMPYAMFFSKYYAIHGSNDVPGYNASHGCIRVYPSDARWLNQNFLDYGSTVIVKPY